MSDGNFGGEVGFLSRHTDLIVLDVQKPALVAVAPAWQGRVMTSTPGGPEGPSLGWVNRRFIESGRRDTAFDNYGGEDRFWLGPEGGQFALWFSKGQGFELANWRTPPGLNAGQFSVTSRGPGSVAMAARFDCTNYSGARFEVAVKRIVDVLSLDQVAAHLGCAVPPGLAMVAFQTTNTLANVGRSPWRRDTGLLSVWTLGQFNPLPRGLVIVPFIPGPEDKLGPLPNGAYFGQPPADRFRVGDGHVLFRCDGRHRGKLGVGPLRARRAMGSYDPDAGLLSLVQFNLPTGAARLPYVNSLWEIQGQPYAGDVVNSYNDGPAGDAEPLGGFYELETSSPAAELDPEQAITQVHRTYHFAGDPGKLNAVAQAVLGVDLTKLEFPA